ncbi:MAG: hypothetical protein Q9162_007057 [Coniocarpon cinnabarinum]
MHSIQPSELRDLILPVLACLPTAFFSPSPPPALLPLLSPILRQRVHLLASSTTPSTEPPSEGSWLKLLTWSPERGARLSEIVSRLQLEPHPVSGELELFEDTTDPDAGRVWYRRLDEETVQARCDVHEYHVGFLFVWSSNDIRGVGLEGTTNGMAHDAWRLAEVVPLEGDENLELEGWHEALAEAEHRSRAMQNAMNGVRTTQASNSHFTSALTENNANEDDEDDYWASYDRTPGKGTPAPSRNASVFNHQGQSEQDYLARYGEVQPAMDAHDPDEEEGARALGATQAGQPHDRNATARNDMDIFRSLHAAIEQQDGQPDMAMPTSQRLPSMPQPHQTNGDPPSPIVAALERSSSEQSTAAETSVKQHISYEMKSLFRLAQGVGIGRGEFDELVRRELEVLGQIEL